jgi:ChrR Cupin-like domain
MTNYNFDDSHINWNQLEGFDHLDYCVLNVDRDNLVVDALFKFAANQQIALHRHVALNHLLVIQGEHILYEPNGDIKERRPTGRYTVSPASEEPHREGGGADQDVIILFSIRGTDGAFYEILDENNSVVATLGMDDFENLLAAQA